MGRGRSRRCALFSSLRFFNANLISLRDELKFSKAYMHVQRERFGENLKVSWNIEEGAKEQFIIPMSLQLLLENAVKHNIISKAKPLEIRVKTETDGLIVQNPLQPKSTKLPSTKLGLKNIRERYALISDKEIQVRQDNGNFTVQLPLLNQKE